MSRIPCSMVDIFEARSPDVASGQVQMAIDTFLLARAVDAGAVVFRLYRMSPPAVTIGRHQRWRRVIDEETCSARGWEWARRPTGGGALLHLNEINYAIIAPRGVLAPQGSGEFRRVFDVIGQALADSLRSMGYNPELHFGQRDSNSPQHGLCGRSITGNEIAVRGRKIIAAAQTITPLGILQHGTIYLTAPEQTDRFWPESESCQNREEFVQRWGDLGPSLAKREWEETAREFERGFKRNLPFQAHTCELSKEDWTQVGRIARDWQANGWHKSR